MLELKSICKQYPGTSRPAVSRFSAVVDRELLVLVGPSGCGKTTTLRLVAGLEEPDSGEILFNGDDLSAVPPHKRDVAFVFQEAVVYPGMSVRQNLKLAAKRAAGDKSSVESCVRETASDLHLSDLLDRMPEQLSGGERQRVALARAVLRRPRILLLDEPLSNLDVALRLELRFLIRAIYERLGVPTIYVTHDQEEALGLGDRVAIMAAGSIEQIGRPQEVYDRPANSFVAAFTGHPPMNILPVSVFENRVKVTWPPSAKYAGIRPHDLSVVSDHLPVSERIDLSGHVESVQFIGPGYLVHMRVDPSDEVLMAVLNRDLPELTNPVDLFCSQHKIQWFDDNGKRIEPTAGL